MSTGAELNPERTKELQQQEKYIKFLEWARKNGLKEKSVLVIS